MGMDQASGLRQWASNMSAPSDADCPLHVAQALLELASKGRPASRRPARPGAPGLAEPRRGDAVTLMVLGLPGSGMRHGQRVTELLTLWSRQGRQWVGDPAAWRIVPLAANDPNIPALVSQQARWALWVDSDLEAFRRAYRVLKQIAEWGGPRRLLVVHPPRVGREGLLGNLRAAASLMGIDLVVLAR
ncbi:hypothetical protein [Billgrantia endophytica]|uniref:Uncharacterized protein n=1 Tax=Billgrantia endophytica TaxID=2033802 RepID=A0A2N7U113_9GAMM|nr:hypothetical protein [Halomonas endophytica]PMR74126.1 hypothetical protein C1H69_14870 [Halomonas endophytica]